MLVAVLGIATFAGCAAGRAFSLGDVEARAGNWDEAVVYYTQASQEDPDNALYTISLERALLNASRQHLARAQEFEASGAMGAAHLEYTKASEFAPSNQRAAVKIIALERMIRDQVEASRPRSQVQQLRDRIRQTPVEPILNPASRDPLRIQFSDASTRDILSFVGNAVGSVPPLPVLPPTETPAIATPLDPAGPGAAQTPNAPVNPVLDATNPALPARPADTVADGRAGGNATQSAQIVLTPPGLKFQVGAGQYIVPLSISGAARIADLTVTLVYSPAVLRVRAVQEGSFMRQGGVTATFAQDVDTTSGRVDITITRVDDSTGASGSGLLAAVLFEPVAAGRTELEASGVARTPSGGLVPLTFAPVAIEVR